MLFLQNVDLRANGYCVCQIASWTHPSEVGNWFFSCGRFSLCLGWTKDIKYKKSTRLNGWFIFFKLSGVETKRIAEDLLCCRLSGQKAVKMKVKFEPIRFWNNFYYFCNACFSLLTNFFECRMQLSCLLFILLLLSFHSFGSLLEWTKWRYYSTSRTQNKECQSRAHPPIPKIFNNMLFNLFSLLLILWCVYCRPHILNSHTVTWRPNSIQQ